MPPPFILEALKHPVSTERNPRLLYTKNLYGKNVKTDNWQYRYVPSDPAPQYPFGVLATECEEKEKSDCICDHYKSTYKIMNEQLDLKENYIDPHGEKTKQFFNYFGYSGDEKADEMWMDWKAFPTILKNDYFMGPNYMTTMQMSYSPPQDLILRRLRAPEEKFMLYRRMKGINNPQLNTTYRDERIEEVTRQMQCARQGRHVSYNFMIGRNNDGSLPKEMTMRENNLLVKQLNQN